MRVSFKKTLALIPEPTKSYYNLLYEGVIVMALKKNNYIISQNIINSKFLYSQLNRVKPYLHRVTKQYTTENESKLEDRLS